MTLAQHVLSSFPSSRTRASTIDWIATFCLLVTTSVVNKAQKPELVVQIGHSDSINQVIFSPDGKLIASASSDGTVKVWDALEGKQLRTFSRGSVDNSMAFSADGKSLAIGDGRGITSTSRDRWATIKLLDIPTGREIRVFRANGDTMGPVAFSPNGNTLAATSWFTPSTAVHISSGPNSASGYLTLWNARTGAEIRTFTTHGLVRFAFSPDENLFAWATDRFLNLCDVATGAVLRTLAPEADLSSFVFSPDGKALAISTRNGELKPAVTPGEIQTNTIKLWDVATGVEMRTITKTAGSNAVINPRGAAVFSPDGKTLAASEVYTLVKPGEVPTGTVKLWDASTGAEIASITENYLGEPDAFSPDGKILAIDVGKFWDIAQKKIVRTIANSVALSPDWHVLASTEGNWIRLWDVNSGEPLRYLVGQPPASFSMAVSPDGRTLASGLGTSGPIQLWDISGATGARVIDYQAWVSSLVFSPDGKILASGTSDWYSEVALWEVSSGKQLARYQPYNAPFGYVLAFSPDGRTLAAGSSDNTIKILTVPALSEVRTLSGHAKKVESVSFSPKGDILASVSVDGVIKLWNITSGVELYSLGSANDSWELNSIDFSPDGKILASGNINSETKLWNVSTGHELMTLSGNGGASVTFNPRGKTLGAITRNGVKIWETSSGKELLSLPVNNSPRDIRFSPDGRYLFGSEHSSIVMWNLATGKELARLISFGGQHWVVASPDGLFDGSPAAWTQLYWRFNNNAFDQVPVEAFYNEFYRPDLLSEILTGRHPLAPPNLLQKDRRQPHLTISVVGSKYNTPLTNRNIRVEIAVSEIGPDEKHRVGTGAQDVRLFRNGSLVKVWRGDVLKGNRSVTLETSMPIVAGENYLTAYAFNNDNIKSRDATLTVTGAENLKRKGVAYILAVGVNQYANSQYNLKYAVADAHDFAAELKQQQTKLNNYERVEVISLDDNEATKANILGSLSALSTEVEPEDALIIYFAGHGTAQQNRFYLVPYDLGYLGSRMQLTGSGLRAILSHSISDKELQRAIESIDAGQMLLVIDACNSGQALEAEDKRRGPMNSKGLAQLAYEKGMYILTAAQSYQAANEAAKLGHGYLTYALIEEGMKTNAADKQPKDGQVLLREWLDYAAERVPQMQQQELEQQQTQGRQLDRIKFAETDLGNERSLQRPRVFYRREADQNPLVIARP